jgi:hypothetical protein
MGIVTEEAGVLARRKDVQCGWLLISVLASLFPLAACHGPAATPTPVSTPTAALPPPVTVDLSGKISGTGILLEDVVIVSSDGRAKMTIEKGSRVRDEQNQPGKSITCTPMIPPESGDGVVVGLAYDFGGAVAGGKVSPPAEITISYDPPPAGPRIDLNKPDIAGWWPQRDRWILTPDPATVDLTTHTIKSWQAWFLPAVVIFWYEDLVPPIS